MRGRKYFIVNLHKSVFLDFLKVAENVFGFIIINLTALTSTNNDVKI